MRRARPDELGPMGLPDQVCRVVSALGAPVSCGDYFAAEPWSFLDAGLRPSGSSSRLRTFGTGWNDTTAFCLDSETPTVHGVVVQDGRIVDELYVNRDYATFMAFLCHLRVLLDVYQQVSVEAYLREVPVVRDHLARLDKDALVDGAWWVGLVEEFDMV
ncbi:SUKH-4 family immunity protein [Asanoa ferruginea]|uniref:SUKH-4 family immunity protein n=1 Tax=Asanoa ferruginea TaxID=53367 RepID=UPI0023B24589|nr:SUKH-4 family immunity protein [Asanoa ferruginea]